MQARLTKQFVLEIIFSIFMVCLLVYRVHFGIDFRDESWYVAEPYAVANLGLIPFVNNITQSPGFTLPLALAYWCYTSIEGTDGIFLFSRLLYVTTVIIISLVEYIIARKNYKVDIPFVVFAVLIASSNAYCLFDLNYNTIGLIYYPLIMLLVFAKYESFGEVNWYGFWAGFLAVRATMASPQIFVGLLVIFLYLIFKKKFNIVKWIIIGALFLCCVIFGTVIIKWGWVRVYSWFGLFFNQGYLLIEKHYGLLHTLKYLFKMFLPAIVTFYLVSLFINKMDSNQKKILLDYSIIALIITGIFFSWVFDDYYGTILAYGTWFLPYMYAFFVKKKYYKEVLVVCSSYLTIYLFASVNNVFGFYSCREYWFTVPIIINLLLIYNDVFRQNETHKNHIRLKYCCLLCFVLLACYKMWCNFFYVYNDEAISRLDARIETGVWKGIYTTPKKEKSVTDLEFFLKSITDGKDRVLCFDLVPFAYIMVNGKICSPTTLDIGVYEFKVNDPTQCYTYFKAEKNVPTHIMYIDYDKKEQLSINDEKWKFNEFVNKYYRFHQEYSNDAFMVKDYIIVDEQNAMNEVKSMFE